MPRPQIHPPVVPVGRPEKAVVAFGSNLGDREATIREAVERMSRVRGITVLAVSDAVGSVAVKLVDGHASDDASAPGYLNGVVIVETTLEPHVLLAELNHIEAELGRVREEVWGDRTIDLDIVTYGNRRVNTSRLTIPHPRAAEREFVLAPWLAIDPDATLPGRGRVDAVLQNLSDARPTQGESP